MKAEAKLDFLLAASHIAGMRKTSTCLVLVALASCGEPVRDDHFADDVKQERPAAAPVRSEAVPVRVGELGPNFPACNAAGTTRNLAAGQDIPVRAAPFDTSEQSGRLAAGSRFVICSRSHDQKWFGIVYNDQGSLDTCGVTSPVPARRAYEGPCQSGWVSAPFVKFTAGLKALQPAE